MRLSICYTERNPKCTTQSAEQLDPLSLWVNQQGSRWYLVLAVRFFVSSDIGLHTLTPAEFFIQLILRPVCVRRSIVTKEAQRRKEREE